MAPKRFEEKPRIFPLPGANVQSVFPSASNQALISTFLADMAFSDSWTDMVDFSWQRIFRRTLSIQYGLPVWWMHNKSSKRAYKST